MELAIVASPESHRTQALMSNNLSMLSLHRYARTRDIVDILEAAILKVELAVFIIPEVNLDRAGWLNKLGIFTIISIQLDGEYV